MLRRSVLRWASAADVAAAIRDKAREKGPKIAARGDTKLSKLRTIQQALERDRDAFEASKPFSLVESIKEFPWKSFIVFMIVWTWFGYYVIPTFRGLNPDGTMSPETTEYDQRRKLELLSSERRRLLIRKRELRERKEELLAEEARKAASPGGAEPNSSS